MVTAIVTIRTARKRHTCSRCDQDIDPGDRYESSSLPPGAGDSPNTAWRHGASHVGAWLRGRHASTKADHARIGIACDEAAAYRDAQHRMLVASNLLPQEALNG
jgi:hypothetical protein